MVEQIEELRTKLNRFSIVLFSKLGSFDYRQIEVLSSFSKDDVPTSCAERTERLPRKY